MALQHTSEGLLVELFDETQISALDANRLTIMQKDLKLAIRMMGWTRHAYRATRTGHMRVGCRLAQLINFNLSYFGISGLTVL